MFEGADTLSQFDVAVIIIILLSSVFAFLRGFIKEILLLTGWVGAISITLYAFPHAANAMGDLFKSSKVVNIAAVCCASTMRSAILARKRVIGTLCSLREGPGTATIIGAESASPGVTFSSLWLLR